MSTPFVRVNFGIVSVSDQCQDIADFGKIAVCFQKMVPLLNGDVLNKYLNKCEALLLTKRESIAEETERVRSVLKAVVLLNFKIWQNRYHALLKRLMLSTRGSLKLLSVEELCSLHEVRTGRRICYL